MEVLAEHRAAQGKDQDISGKNSLSNTIFASATVILTKLRTIAPLCSKRCQHGF